MTPPTPQPGSESQPPRPVEGWSRRAEQRLLAFLLPEAAGDLERRLFHGLTLLGGLLAFFVILPLNYFQHLFPLVNWLVALVGVVSFALNWAARRGHPLPGTYFVTLLLLLDAIWFGNAGSEGSIGMFFMSASVYLAIFIHGRHRWAMLGLFLANGVGLYLIERAYPHLVTRFPDPDSRFIDLTGSFVVCNLIIIVVLWVVLGSYHQERERQQGMTEALKASEARFRSLVEQSPIAMLLAGPSGEILGMNQAFARGLGYSREDLPDEAAWWTKAYPNPELRERARRAWNAALTEAMATGQPVPPQEFPLACKDGTQRNMEIQAAFIEGSWLVMFTDLTDRRQAEAALEDREQQLLRAQEAGQVGTFTWDIARDHWDSSPVLDRLLGLPADFVYTLASWNALIRADFREPMQHYVEGLLRDRAAFNQEYPVIRPLDGREIWVQGRAEIEFSPEGIPLRMVGTIQDISAAKQAEEARRALESQVLRAQKMESLGSLAGGVAHDMNNVLGAILALSSAHQSQQAEGSGAWRAMETIGKACLRGRSLVQGLLNFTRKELSEARALDLNGLVQEEVRLLEHTTLGKVRLEMALEDDLPRIQGDPAALSHALMNLCVNALDAMPGGGTLRLATRRLTPRSVELEVQDSGSGMTPEVLSRALDPYFTTKPHGKGTGLGLALVYTTLKAHGGSIELSSQAGQGTTVRLRFPALDEEQPPSPSEPGSGRGRSFRGRVVLMVDDDPMIREALGPLLESLGHQVQEADSGEAALAWLAQGSPVDGVVLDLNMPGMDGAETLVRLRRNRPDLPVLLATGRPDQAALDLVAAHPGVALLAKPFSRRELGEALDRWP